MAVQPVTFRRREGDADPRPEGAAADADYFGNLRKFARHDNMAEPPTRDNTLPSQQCKGMRSTK